MTEQIDKHPLLVARDGVRAAEAVFEKIVSHELKQGTAVRWMDRGQLYEGVVDSRFSHELCLWVRRNCGRRHLIHIDDIIRALER